MKNPTRDNHCENKVIPSSELNDEDEKLCNNIRLQLSHYLHLPISRPNTDQIFDHIRDILTINVREQSLYLQSKFGKGSLFIYAKTPRDFYNANFEIPTQISFLLHPSLIIGIKGGNNIFFAPQTVAELMNIPVPFKNIHANHEVVCTVKINDLPKHDNFVYYQCSILHRTQEFDAFLRQKKWKLSQLKEKLPEFAKLFNSADTGSLISCIPRIMKDDKMTLRRLSNFFIPQNIAPYIDEPKQKELIQKLVNDIYDKIDLNEAKYQEIVRSKFLLTVPKQQGIFLMLHQFPFLDEAMKTISNLVGMNVLAEAVRSEMSQNEHVLMMKKAMKLTQRIEGRKCALCKRKEIRSDDMNEIFRKCKGCQSEWYCSIKCQKKHWNTHHRHHCKSLQKWSFFN